MIDFFRELFLKDFWLKLFSFVLAVLIWFTVWFALQKNEGAPLPTLALTPAEQKTFSNLPVVPVIHVLASADDVRDLTITPKEVDVTVQGDTKAIRDLRAKDLRILVDLTGVATTHQTRQTLEVSMPPGVSHFKVEPPQVDITFPPPPQSDSSNAPAKSSSVTHAH